MLDHSPMTDAQAGTALPRNEDGSIDAGYVAAVKEAIAAQDVATLQDLAGALHEADTGDLIEALDHDERPLFISLLGETFDFTALTEVDDTVRGEILEALPTQTVVEGVRDLDSDDAAYILEDLSKDEQAEILERLEGPERVALQKILDYPENSAGRRMQAEFIAVPASWTVGHAIDYMRETEDLPDRFYELYVLDEDGKFLGAVSARPAAARQAARAARELMDPDRRRVRATEDQEEVARLFEHYNLVAAPVIDENDRLVGVITIDDVVDLIAEEAEEDIMALGGVAGDEELSDSTWTIVRSRFPWLLANLGLSLITVWVISRFEASIAQMVALAVLMPIVASMGGNAATQTMTVTVRALATRDLTDSSALRVIRREVMVGIANGIGFAIILGPIAAFAFGINDLGFVIALAVICVLTAGALGGIVIPLLLTRMRSIRPSPRGPS